MKVKVFEFPSFDNWSQKCQYDYTAQVGDYYARISLFSWSTKDDSHLYKAAVSSSRNPLNIYATSLISMTEMCLNSQSSDFTDKLKEWYETSVNSINEKFSEMILDTYLENPRSNDSVVE